MSARQPMWRVSDVTFRYPGAEVDTIREFSLRIERGMKVAVVGPNGSGKSTLIRLLVGARRPGGGVIELMGRRLDAWSRMDVARRLGVMAQHEEPAFPIVVRSLVAMGRFPYLGSWRAEREIDRRAIEEAMRRCDVATIAGRSFETLSGGERQRTRLARALAQEPDALVLDEPTSGLDVAAEMEIWGLLDRESTRGTTVVLSTHNVNLAARHADRIAILHRGRLVAYGTPREVIDVKTVGATYGWPVAVVPFTGAGPSRGAPQIVTLDGEMSR